MKNNALTIDEALAIARREIAGVINNSERLRKYEFKPVRYRRETDRYWVFSAASEQLIEEGYVPGAVSACVDKVDGHIWSVKEQEQYAQSLSPFPPPPRPVSADGKVMMDIEEGLAIAQREISKIIENSDELRGYEFDSVRLRRWNDNRWVFSAESTQPDGDESTRREVSVSVDPFDGHILSAEEQRRLGEPDDRISQPESVAA